VEMKRTTRNMSSENDACGCRRGAIATISNKLRRNNKGTAIARGEEEGESRKPSEIAFHMGGALSDWKKSINVKAVWVGKTRVIRKKSEKGGRARTSQRLTSIKGLNWNKEATVSSQVSAKPVHGLRAKSSIRKRPESSRVKKVSKDNLLGNVHQVHIPSGKGHLEGP